MAEPTKSYAEEPGSKLTNADWRERWFTLLTASCNPFDGASQEQVKNEAQ
jgi:hypothetical protein